MTEPLSDAELAGAGRLPALRDIDRASTVGAALSFLRRHGSAGVADAVNDEINAWRREVGQQALRITELEREVERLRAEIVGQCSGFFECQLMQVRGDHDDSCLVPLLAPVRAALTPQDGAE